MKVFVTGATGVLGRPTVAQLIAAGHEVRGVARSEDAALGLKAAGAEPAHVDLFDPPRCVRRWSAATPSLTSRRTYRRTPRC